MPSLHPSGTSAPPTLTLGHAPPARMASLLLPHHSRYAPTSGLCTSHLHRISCSSFPPPGKSFRALPARALLQFHLLVNLSWPLSFKMHAPALPMSFSTLQSSVTPDIFILLIYWHPISKDGNYMRTDFFVLHFGLVKHYLAVNKHLLNKKPIQNTGKNLFINRKTPKWTVAHPPKQYQK